jgi:hypothetical protein
MRIASILFSAGLGVLIASTTIPAAEAQVRRERAPAAAQDWPVTGQTPHEVPLPRLTQHEISRGCYASREQGYVGGKLVWRQLVVCPYRDDRN